MIIAGLDEAALGPSLGPFCACLVRFQTAGDDRETNLYSSLAASVISEPPKASSPSSKIAVGDSKKLYTPARGISLLEKAVFSFLETRAGCLPQNFYSLLTLLAGKETSSLLSSIPWFAGAEKLALPLNPVSSETSEKLKKTMDAAGVSLLPVKLRFVPAKEFNRHLKTEKGKSGAIRSILNPLMLQVLNSSNPTRFIIDRQGSRRYYGEWLAELQPGQALTAREEGPARSLYRTGIHDLRFLVKADAAYLEVALASIFAKYVRELAMILFNHWWTDRLPALKPTAGYPRDAKRFVEDLKSGGVFPQDPDQLIRRL